MRAFLWRMKTQRANPLAVVAAAIFILVGLTGELPAFAQLASDGASIALVATLSESVTIHHHTVPIAEPFAEEGANPFEVYYSLSPNSAAQTPNWETKPQTADRNFWLWTGVAVGLTVADIELTQHCIYKGVCREGNPMMPTTSRAKLYPLQFGITAAHSYLAYRLKKKGTKRWWLPQFSLSVSHGVGVAFGVRFALTN